MPLSSRGSPLWCGLRAMHAERIEVLGAVQSRVHAVLGPALSAQECVAVATAASCRRDRDSILGFVLSTAHNKLVAKHVDALALCDEEWAALFNAKSAHPTTSELLNAMGDATLDQTREGLESALRHSLAEPVAREKWKRPFTVAACYLALHCENAEGRISAALGGFVKSDSRRLEDARSRVEDDGADELLLSKVVLALSASVCKL